jgi:hypothetical protein
MPYLLLLLGVLFGIFALYRFFLRAEIHQIKSLIAAAVTITVCAALFLLSVTGRLPAAIGIVSAIAPFAIAWLNRGTKPKAPPQGHFPQDKPLDRKEALNILGLEEAASDEDIEAAYKRLMKKLHPDQDGSDWMASKLNAARDFLVKK